MDVKRASVAAENVDVAASHRKILAYLFSAHGKISWRIHEVRALVVEKLRAAWVKISVVGVLRLRAIKPFVMRWICEALRSHGTPGQAG